MVHHDVWLHPWEEEESTTKQFRIVQVRGKTSPITMLERDLNIKASNPTILETKRMGTSKYHNSFQNHKETSRVASTLHSLFKNSCK